MRGLSLLIKPASSKCNMKCLYCFYADITDIREVKDRGIMSFSTLKNIIKKAFNETNEYLYIGFQGGEPTLSGLDFYKKVIYYVEKYNIKNIKVAYAIQTNGLLVDEKWTAFFKENNFLVGLSIDGYEDIHNSLRVDFFKKGTFNKCMEAISLFKKYKVDFNILCVVTKKLAKNAKEVYNFYKSSGFKYIQFIPCMDGLEEEHGINEFSLSDIYYGKFLCEIFDLWYIDYINGKYISIRAFDNYIHMLAGILPENCAMNGICSVSWLIEADGSVYPCDFYAIDKFLLGNINKENFLEMFNNKTGKYFVESSFDLPEECTKCQYIQLCRGGCRRDCEPFKNGKRTLNLYCRSYKMFFEKSLKRMSDISKSII